MTSVLRIVTTAVWLAPCSCFAASGFAAVVGSGRIVTESRAVEVFTGVRVGAGILATVSAGSQQLVKLEGDDNILPRVSFVVRGGLLCTEVDGSISPSRRIRLTVVTPKLTAAESHGGADVVVQATAAATFAAEATGGGHLRVTGLAAESVAIVASGGGDVVLVGRSRGLTARLSGGGTLRTVELPVGTAQVVARGDGCAQRGRRTPRLGKPAAEQSSDVGRRQHSVRELMAVHPRELVLAAVRQGVSCRPSVDTSAGSAIVWR
jgi:hypothetical protein